MQHHYYIGEGPEAEALIAEVKHRRADVNAARKALCNEYSADCILGHNCRAVGLFFKEKQNRPYLKGEKSIDGGYGYYPKLNYKAGKELSGKLRNPDLPPFIMSDYIIDRLKISRRDAGTHAASLTGMALYFSVAYIVDRKILAKITGSDKGHDDVYDPMPSVPAWFREVKESEWLAVQGI